MPHYCAPKPKFELTEKAPDDLLHSMIKVFSICSVLLAAASLGFAQSEMPAEISLKLDEKAKALFPDDLKKQDKWIRDQDDGWIRLSILAVDENNKAYFERAKAFADKKFDLDFAAKAEFLQKAADGLTMIDAYAFMFKDKAAFERLKTEALAANPEDYSKAAKHFEAQSAAIVEIENIPMPESIDQELFDAIKKAAAAKFPSDFSKQKEYVQKYAERLNAFAQYEATQSAQEEVEGESAAFIDKIAVARDTLANAVVMVNSERSGIGFCTTIKDKDVIIFPSYCYSPYNLTITNRMDDRIVIGDVYAAKNQPIVIAFVKSKPDHIKPVKIATEDELKASVGKPAFIFSITARDIQFSRTKLVSIGKETLNMGTRLASSFVEGSTVSDTERADLMGMLVANNNYDALPELTNKGDVKYLVKSLNRERLSLKAVRVDNISGWEKLDPANYSQQVEEINAFAKSNLDFLQFFMTNTLTELEANDELRKIAEKYGQEFKQRVDRAAYEKQLKDMLYEVVAAMKRTTLKRNPDEVFTALRDEYSFNIQVREKMIQTLEKAMKTRGFMAYSFMDIKPKM